MVVKQVLVVEDNPSNMELVVDILQMQGHQVWQAKTGQEALEMLKDRKPDLILMDVQLPGIDGLSLTRMLKSDPSTKDIAVIALTALAMKEDEVKAYEAGCSAFLAKPFRLQQFMDTVSSLLKDSC